MHLKIFCSELSSVSVTVTSEQHMPMTLPAHSLLVLLHVLASPLLISKELVKWLVNLMIPDADVLVKIIASKPVLVSTTPPLIMLSSFSSSVVVVELLLLLELLAVVAAVPFALVGVLVLF